MLRVLHCLLIAALALPVCARPYSGRVSLAEETLLQARDKRIDYERKIDRAIDGSPADLVDFIRLIGQLDAAGAYFHYFHVYQAAKLAGDSKLLAAVRALKAGEQSSLVQGLAEARGWDKGGRNFGREFPLTAEYLRQAGQTINF